MTRILEQFDLATLNKNKH